MSEAATSCCLPSRESGETLAPSQTAPQIGSTANMKFLPGGEFWMGDDGPQARPEDGEGPVRRVRLAPFYLGITAVTNAEFAEFVDKTGYQTEAEKFGWSYVFHKHLTAQAKQNARGSAGGAPWWIGVDDAFWRKPEGPGSNLKKREDFPVVQVSWADANAFCAWAGKRLPTEAEWEFAARGGLERKIFPWGDEMTPGGKHQMNTWQGKFPDLDTGADGFSNVAPAKSFKPNGFGLYNMTGNTWDWCSDWFSAHHEIAEILENPTGPPTGELKTIRGGSFLCHVSYCNRYRCSARTANTPDSATAHCGFRCAREA